MFATPRDFGAVYGGRAAWDGAELPLIDPRLLATLIGFVEQRSARAGSAECLILSELHLGRFDPKRLQEVRAALIGSFPSERHHPVSNRERLQLLRRLTAPLIRRGANVAACLLAAFMLGLVSGLIA